MERGVTSASLEFVCVESLLRYRKLVRQTEIDLVVHDAKTLSVVSKRLVLFDQLFAEPHIIAVAILLVRAHNPISVTGRQNNCDKQNTLLGGASLLEDIFVDAPHKIHERFIQL